MRNKRKIYFRADAGVNIGYGHFIRTLALADMLKNNFDCTFFTQNPTSYQIGEMEKICPFIVLSEKTKFEDFLDLLSGKEIVVLDNYFFTTEYQQQIKDKGCRLVCIDDVHDKHYVADVIINQDIIDSSLFSVESNTKLCLGTDYALLRRPFLEQSLNLGVRRFLVTICFGGSDPYDMTGKTINYILSNTNYQVIAIVGDAYNFSENKIISKRLEYRSRLSAKQMVELFQKSKLVICSASTVCIEALTCGARIATGWYVDNQKEYYNVLKEQGLIIPLGYLPSADFKMLKESYELNTYNALDGIKIKNNILGVFNQIAEL